MSNFGTTTVSSMPTRRKGDLTSEDVAGLMTAGPVAVDIETSGLDYRHAHIGTVQLANDKGESWIIQVEDGTRPLRIVQLLEEPSVRKILHYAPFDLGFMRYHWSVRAANVACTKILDRLVSPLSSSHSLKDILQRELGVRISKDPGIRVSDWVAESLSQEQVRYAIGDVEHLIRLYGILMEKARQRGLVDVAEESFRYLPIRVETELLGIDDLFAY